MGAYGVVGLVALIIAVCVLVAAIRGSNEDTSWRSFVSNFRNGLRRDRGKNPEPDVDPIDVTIEDLFETESEPGDDYMQLDDVAHLIERTGDRTAQLWHHARDQRHGHSGAWETSHQRETSHPHGRRSGTAIRRAPIGGEWSTEGTRMPPCDREGSSAGPLSR